MMQSTKTFMARYGRWMKNWSQRRELLIMLHVQRQFFNELTRAKNTGRDRLERLLAKLDSGSDWRCAEEVMKFANAEILRAMRFRATSKNSASPIAMPSGFP